MSGCNLDTLDFLLLPQGGCAKNKICKKAKGKLGRGPTPFGVRVSRGAWESSLQRQPARRVLGSTETCKTRISLAGEDGEPDLTNNPHPFLSLHKGKQNRRW